MKGWVKLTMLLLTVMLLSACGVTVKPLPTASAKVDPKNLSISETHNDINLTVKLDELHFAPYQMVDNITSFHVTADNQSDQSITLSSDHFLIRDNENYQFNTISPERVRDIVSKDTVYLIPYPYVGYYYLEDQERFVFENARSGPLPFYAEYHPQDIFTRALPEGELLAHSKTSGLIYFIVDVTDKAGFDLLVRSPSDPDGSPVYRFPFVVEK